MIRFSHPPRLRVSYDGPLTTSMPGGGVLPDVTASTVFAPPGEDDQAFNFHPHPWELPSGRLFVMHSTHAKHEDRGGQFVQGHTSDDGGATWTPRGTILPAQSSLDLVGTSDNVSPIPTGFLDIDGTLYALIDVHERTNSGRSGLQLLGVSVTDDGETFGTPVLIHPDVMVPYEVGFPTYLHDPALAQRVLRSIGRYGLPWSRSLDFWPWPAVGDGEIVEHCRFQLAADRWIAYGRKTGTGSEWMWAATSRDGHRFGAWQQTALPNGSSKPFGLVASDGRMILILNPNNGRSSLMLTMSEDGLTWLDDNTYRIVPTGPSLPQYPGIAKNANDAYPAAIQISGGDILLVSGRRGKEEIEAKRFPLPDMTA